MYYLCRRQRLSFECRSRSSRSAFLASNSSSLITPASRRSASFWISSGTSPTALDRCSPVGRRVGSLNRREQQASLQDLRATLARGTLTCGIRPWARRAATTFPCGTYLRETVSAHAYRQGSSGRRLLRCCTVAAQRLRSASGTIPRARCFSCKSGCFLGGR